jgi:N-methylhydantoinase A/oxoprolinase/acetone carboxylase beta subunit
MSTNTGQVPPVGIKRIGIDVGGTNTDAVLVEGSTVLGAVKTVTSEDVTGGVRAALKNLAASTGDAMRDVTAVMIGTTHFVNAVVQRRDLNRAGALRVCLPASASLPPMVDWPDDLAALANGGNYLVAGGHEYDGRPIVALDERAIAEAGRKMKADGIAAAAVSAVFSPLTDACELRAADILRNENPDLHITRSGTLGRIGLLEHENAALLNACLIDLSHRTIDAFEEAIRSSGIEARLYITQNDGTVVDAATARDQPVFSFASGPTNSMRGAAFLAGIGDAIVVDIGGTTSDVGCLKSGYPREANNVVKVGGVRTLFRMPDLLSIGLGGSTIVAERPLSIGPRSVGHRLRNEALVFGGETLTLSDIAVAAGLVEMGDKARVAHLPSTLIKDTITEARRMLTEAVDRMKTEASDPPLLAVGGAAMLTPERMDGICEVVRVPHHAVANAVGAAMAQISGEVDHVFRDMEREELLAEAERMARDRAIAAGAAADTLKVVDIDSIPMSYMPGRAVRARVRVVGDITALRAAKSAEPSST